jgi:hypothetical protein
MVTLLELRDYLKKQPEGQIHSDSLSKILSRCWDDLAGSGAESTTPDKLSRIENVQWNPPQLTFVIERHGGTVMGSTRADLHRWIIDIDRGVASCDPNHSYRQLYKRDAPLHLEPLVAEIVTNITSGSDDPRVKWFPGRDTVRVLVREFIQGQFKQTQAGRRKRFRNALAQRLQAGGWEIVSGKMDVFRRVETAAPAERNSEWSPLG